MSNFLNVMIIVEGKTESLFVKNVLAPYMALKQIYMTAVEVSKPGMKGGDVKFSRVSQDIARHLKQRSDIKVSLFVDYYGIDSEWPGLIEGGSLDEKISTLIEATVESLKETLPKISLERFIPYFAVHEFEALLFSDPVKLASKLKCSKESIESILEQYKSPEEINNSRTTAPSKRLNSLCQTGNFRKTTTGVAVAKDIGIDKMREECPYFHKWLTVFENLVSV